MKKILMVFGLFIGLGSSAFAMTEAEFLESIDWEATLTGSATVSDDLYELYNTNNEIVAMTDTNITSTDKIYNNIIITNDVIDFGTSIDTSNVSQIDRMNGLNYRVQHYNELQNKLYIQKRVSATEYRQIAIVPGTDFTVYVEKNATPEEPEEPVTGGFVLKDKVLEIAGLSVTVFSKMLDLFKISIISVFLGITLISLMFSVVVRRFGKGVK